MPMDLLHPTAVDMNLESENSGHLKVPHSLDFERNKPTKNAVGSQETSCTIEFRVQKETTPAKDMQEENQEEVQTNNQQKNPDETIEVEEENIEVEEENVLS